MLLIMSIINKWATRQINFVMAYPQANIECPMYMQIPQGFRVQGTASQEKQVIKLTKNIYGQKKEGQVWNQHLTKGLTKIGFRQSKVDDCVFFCKDVILMIYVDDGLLASPRPSHLTSRTVP